MDRKEEILRWVKSMSAEEIAELRGLSVEDVKA